MPPNAQQRADDILKQSAAVEPRAYDCRSRPTSRCKPRRTAAVAPSGSGGGHAIRITSEHSESNAKAPFRARDVGDRSQLAMYAAAA